MKSRIVAVVGLGLVVAVMSLQAAGDDPPKAAAKEAPPSELKDQKSKGSYGYGLKLGRVLKAKGIDLDPDLFAKGMKDGIAGAKALISDEEIEAALRAIDQEASARIPEQNKKAGEAFLAENKKKEGVVTLKSGLQYKVIKEGNGKIPAATDTVTTHYRGTLLDGTEFDSSYKRNAPATFAVNGVIRGWTEALQKMKVGSKWQLFIPSDLAYGPEGRGPTIGPNSTLLFDIELLDVK
jgi:FKBP-type peptidyl-prolyl cis-trans isomerase FklB